MSSTLGQVIRYGIVGIVSNGIGYLLYLAITASGVEHKLAMTILYCVGVAQTFVLNRRWTFRSPRSPMSALVRYGAVYALGYVLNYSILLLLVDGAGLPHQMVMGGLFVLMAAYFFLAQKYWVFRVPCDAALARSR